MKDKKQRVTSYTTASRVKVYETEQYNKDLDTWYIVGHCSPSKRYLKQLSEHHNRLIGYGIRY